jgi:hypothetical protein
MNPKEIRPNSIRQNEIRQNEIRQTGRTSLVILIAAVCLLAGFLLRAVIQEYLVAPLALLFWLMWRYFQSIDQAICWGALIIGIIFYAFYRLINRPQALEETPPEGFNASLETLAYWRMMVQLTDDEFDRPNMLKTELGKMLATIYTLREPASGSAGPEYSVIYQALKNGQIPLPASIQQFLFPLQHRANRSLEAWLQRAVALPRRWMLHWTGRDRQEYLRTIAEVLAFMDSLMENNHDSP